MSSSVLRSLFFLSVFFPLGASVHLSYGTRLASPFLLCTLTLPRTLVHQCSVFSTLGVGFCAQKLLSLVKFGSLCLWLGRLGAMLSAGDRHALKKASLVACNPCPLSGARPPRICTHPSPSRLPAHRHGTPSLRHIRQSGMYRYCTSLLVPPTSCIWSSLSPPACAPKSVFRVCCKGLEANSMSCAPNRFK